MAFRRSHPSLETTKLKYKEAIEYLQDQNVQIALLTKLPDPLQPRAVDVCFYEPGGMTLRVFNAGELVLTHETTVKRLVVQLQTLLDWAEQDDSSQISDQLIVCEIDVRVEGNLMTASLPAIKGVPSFAPKDIGMFPRFQMHLIYSLQRVAKLTGYHTDLTVGPRLEGIFWEHTDPEVKDMEVYWSALRECLLVGTSFMVLCQDGQRPIFKIKTLRKAPTEPIKGLVDIFAKWNGHVFMNDLDCLLPGSLENLPEVFTPIPMSILKIASTREKEFLEAMHEGFSDQFHRLLHLPDEQAAANPQRTPSPPKRDLGEKMAENIDDKNPKEAAMPFMSKIMIAKPAGIRLQPNPSESDLAFGLVLAQQALESEKAKNNLRGNGEGSSKMTEKPDVFETYRKHLINGGKPLSGFNIKTNTQAESRMSAPAAPKEDWGIWQRMGADPRMHKAFSLEGVPYPRFGAADPGEDKDDDTITPASEKPDTSIQMRGPVSKAEVEYVLEMIQRDKQIKTSVDESAQSFAEKDDEAFIPTIDNPNKDKGKGKAPAFSPKKKASAAFQGVQAKDKKVEALRAIFPPVAQRNSMQSSPYLNALGSSGIAPPPGLYNNMASTSSSPVSSVQFSSGTTGSFHPNTGMTNNLALGDQAQNHFGMAGTSSFGFQTSSGMGNPATSAFQTASGMGNTFSFGYQFNSGLPSTSIFANWQPPQNPYQPAMNQASTASSPLTSWSHLAPLQPPGSGFYDPVYTGLSNDMNMGSRRSSLGHIARTASHSGFQNTTGTTLRADTPVFTFAPANLGVRTTYPPAGYGVQAGGSARGRSGTDQGQGGASGNASGSGAGDGGQQNIDYTAEGDSLSKAAKKWLA